MTWRCCRCGALTDSPSRVFYCARCGAISSWVAIARSPALSPGRPRPVKAGSLGQAEHGPALPSPWSKLGRLGQPIKIGIHGPAGSGKTTQALSLAETFEAAGWGPVLFDAVDESLESASFRDRLRRGEITRIHVLSASWSELSAEILSGDWKMVFVDTVNLVGCRPDELSDYARVRQISFVAVFEETKSGLFRGDSGWHHWCDIFLRMGQGKVFVEKNRYSEVAYA